MERRGAAVLALGLAALTLAGAACGMEESREEKVLRSVKFAKQVLEETGRNQLASSSYQSILETGGDALGYVTASIGEQDDLAPFVRGAPARPFCVVLGPGPEAHTYLIEGYGNDLDKPLVTESVVVTPMPIR